MDTAVQSIGAAQASLEVARVAIEQAAPMLLYRAFRDSGRGKAADVLAVVLASTALSAADRRRRLAFGLLRSLAITAILGAVYYLVPLDRLAFVPDIGRWWGIHGRGGHGR